VQFNCPECNTPHVFPDDEIPEDGLVVACSQCDFHIPLDGQPPADDDPTGIQPGLQAVPEGEDPRAVLSVRIPLDDADWSDIDDSRALPRDSISAAIADHSGVRPKPSIADANEVISGSAMSKALSSLKGSIGFGEEQRNLTPPADFDPSDVSGNLGVELWKWRDLTTALKAPLHGQRFLVVTLGFWVALILFGLIRWCSLWLGSKNDIAGGLISFVAWSALVVGFFLVTAVAAHHCYRELVEGYRGPIRGSVDWVRGWLSSILGAPLICIGLVAMVVVLESLVGFLGRIPYAGSALWGLLTPITFGASLVAGLVVVAIAYGVSIYVPLIVSERTSPVDTLRRMAALFRKHALTLVAMTSVSFISAGVMVCLTVLPALLLAQELTTRVARVTMGPNLWGVFVEAPGNFAAGLSQFINPIGLQAAVETNVGHSIGGVLAGTVSMIAPALVLTTFALLFYAAGGITYAVVTGRPKSRD